MVLLPPAVAKDLTWDFIAELKRITKLPGDHCFPIPQLNLIVSRLTEGLEISHGPMSAHEFNAMESINRPLS